MKSFSGPDTARRLSSLAAVLITAAAAAVASGTAPAAAEPASAVADDPRACTWTVHQLAGLPGGGGAIINSTDDKGAFFGMAKDAEGRGHLVRWTGDTLTEVDSTADWAAAFTNRSGVLAGTIGAPDGSHHGVLWQDGQAVRLYEPPGVYISEVTAVDDAGNLLGDVTSFDWLTHAAIWPAGDPGRIVMLNAPGGTASGAMSADAGQISGFAGASGYIWDTTGALVRKVVPAGRGDIIQLKATSGQISYGTEWLQADAKFRAIQVGASGTVVPLADGDGTAALAANRQGQIAGRDTQHGPAIVWTGGQKIELPGADNLPNGFPMAIDDDGKIAGALYDSAYHVPHPALWSCD
jgi:hypothetical protein